jgi:hypothetical protein
MPYKIALLAYESASVTLRMAPIKTIVSPDVNMTLASLKLLVSFNDIGNPQGL